MLRRKYAGALRRFSTFEDVMPMSIADRVEQAAIRKGAFEGLRGKGKPLPEEDPDSQVHVAQLSKNIEGRAEAEMRRASIAGLLDNLGGQGKPLPDSHGRDSSMGQVAIQHHAQVSTQR
mmetsp:Transcript_9366/g.18953  ORF Transcript_9366/g.18953 Transcript_9366/m.18953 type:complete len:119 (+) Transcript_9366:52-408(+)